MAQNMKELDRNTLRSTAASVQADVHGGPQADLRRFSMGTGGVEAVKHEP